MNAGRLNEVITVERAVIVKDEYGGDENQWKPILVIRSDVQFSSGARANENNEIVFNYNRIFTVRYYNQIKESDRIIWNNQKWRILYLNPDKQKQSLTIYTELINE